MLINQDLLFFLAEHLQGRGICRSPFPDLICPSENVRTILQLTLAGFQPNMAIVKPGFIL